MEPDATTEKKAHHVFGNPNAPLYKDVVKNAGRKKGQNKATWESSVLKYIKPFAQKAEWKPTRWCYEVAATMRMMALRYESVKKVLDVWDTYDWKNKGRKFSLDKACDEAKVDRDEFAGLVLAAVKNDFRIKALAIVELNIGDLVQASVDYASKDVKDASPERMRHLEKHGIIDKPTPASTRINVRASATVPQIPGKSFDAQMTELDNAIDGEILGETRLLTE